MKRSILLFAASVALPLAPAWGATEDIGRTYFGFGTGIDNTTGFDITFIGTNAGSNNTSGNYNTFVGSAAGFGNTVGSSNTFVGRTAGSSNVTGISNTYLGAFAGGNTTGSANVFVGYAAGYSESGSSRLYIDNCAIAVSVPCDQPLIYGEFDNRLLRLDGVLRVAAHAVSKSQLNFSLDHSDTGGYLTSVLDNNFFMSSGARWDGAAGGWVQRSPDGKAVIAGSGSAGYRILTASGVAVGAVAAPVTRLHIDYNGLMGVNAAPVAGRVINTSTGAYLSSGGAWVNASSRALKEDIQDLSPEAALQALRDLKPVTYRYKAEAGETHAGFIAEDAPELVATADRKGLSALDIVAVLTRVVQEKSAALDRQEAQITELKALVGAMAAKLEQIESTHSNGGVK